MDILVSNSNVSNDRLSKYQASIIINKLFAKKKKNNAVDQVFFEQVTTKLAPKPAYNEQYYRA